MTKEINGPAIYALWGMGWKMSFGKVAISTGRICHKNVVSQDRWCIKIEVILTRDLLFLRQVVSHGSNLL